MPHGDRGPSWPAISDHLLEHWDDRKAWNKHSLLHQPFVHQGLLHGVKRRSSGFDQGGDWLGASEDVGLGLVPEKPIAVCDTVTPETPSGDVGQRLVTVARHCGYRRAPLSAGSIPLVNELQEQDLQKTDMGPHGGMGFIGSADILHQV